ncbi:MAG: V-type ATPase subunit [Candidatus Hydrogenedentes bacterium]|nr:V-type ATPase subunit [Candidatus Hydrogenedentota bacterium]
MNMSMDMSTFAAYYNARIRGMKSALFTGEQMDDMLDNEDIETMSEVLLNSPYRADMGEALTRYRGAEAIEDAVSRNFVNTLRYLLDMAEGRFKDLGRLFFRRWDVRAAKSLLRIHGLGLGERQVEESLTVGPTLTMPVLRDLAARESVEELVAGLAAWDPDLCLCLAEYVAQNGSDSETAVMEEMLDRRYYAGTIQQLKNTKKYDDADILRYILALEVDRINLRIVFETLSFKLNVDDAVNRMLNVGTLNHRILKRMVGSGSVVTATEMLSGTRYSLLVEGLFTFMQTGRFSMMTHMFESIVLTEVRRLARRLVLSIAVLMYYTYLKANETRNLRLIARGHVSDVPHARVREGLIHV